MIESEVNLFPVAELLSTLRDTRRKIDPDKVEELAVSILNRGLIHTILVESGTSNLITGAHRAKAFEKLAQEKKPCPYPEYEGWSKIPGRYAFNVDEAEIEALELEENVKRHDLTWQEQCDAVNRFHNICCRRDPEWNATRTAEALGFAPSHISKFLMVAGELSKGNERISKAGTLSAAYGIAARQMERTLANEMEILDETYKEEVGEEPLAEEEIFTDSIIQANFLEWVKTYEGPKFNLIHCDFPYGINHHKSEQGRAETWGEYQDNPEVFWELFHTFFQNLDRFCAKSAHIVFWFSMNYYRDIFDKLTIVYPGKKESLASELDLTLDPFPLIWHKTDNKGLLPDPQRGPRRIYETALLISRGDRKIIQAVSNTYGAPTAREFHLSEKPESVLRHFFRMFVDEETSLLDPTAGSGTALRAAEALGSRRVLGLEIDREHVDAANDALNRARTLRNLSKSTGGVAGAPTKDSVL